MSSKKVFIVDAARTPFGKFGGSLASVSATDLSVQLSSKLIDRANVSREDFDSVVGANVVQSSSDAIYFSRHVALKNNLKLDVPCLNVNRLCGSGFEALVQAAYRIMLDGDDLVLVTASESMSQIPYVLRDARFGYRLGHGKLEDYLSESLTDSYSDLPMALTAENLAQQYNISREEVDEYSFLSQQRASKAWDAGAFNEEVISFDVHDKKGNIAFSKDEHFRSDVSLDGVKKLKPLFKKDGTVTAATASGICDGAASLIVASEK
ncbi:UNVERIFIED_CONTAM: hypothetical protein GTU68_015604, partial [Idotea baltica]|nr:hypothetical protein [Idotea baltica]